ncbi:MAG TPA: zinc ribbon domain-containing protein [Gemmatimonadaceae bacterium]|nr:zinc ribbon domain-containing protein [Gemmatimonadaceae bacterium]
MFRRLVHNIRTLYPDYTTRPFEVAEIYQTLIPYRHNRRELGIDTNEEYELALMRLLSGERGYVGTDAALQEALRRELGSPNPNTSAFRAYGTAQVRLQSDALRRLEQGTLGAAAPAPPPPQPRPAPAPPAPAPPAPRPAAPPPMPAPMPQAMPQPRPDGMHSAATAAAAPTRQIAHPPTPRPHHPAPSVPNAPSSHGGVVAAGSCRYCGGALPDGRRITFCPHCGQNLTIQHCPACGTELELGWKFCVTCGRSVA